MLSVVDSDGRLVSRCPSCALGEVAPPAAAVEEPVAPVVPGRGWKRYAVPAAVAACLALLAAGVRSTVPSPAAVARSFTPSAMAANKSAAGPLRPASPAEYQPALDDDDLGEGLLDGDDLLGDDEGDEPDEDMAEGELLDEELPTLIDWIFPLLGSDESFPLRTTRRFGAVRENVHRKECGRGHCGVDLDGPRGMPVVAVAWGKVVRIEQRSERRSGKYVRIEHPDGVHTSYMHLDAIAPGLVLGGEVQAGDMLGTLGKTGISQGAPHLHFSLEIPSGSSSRHIDPAPYLRRAVRLADDSQDSARGAEQAVR